MRSSSFSGKELQERRNRLGLSQEKFAHYLGVSAKAVINWEAHGSVPREHRIKRINSLLQLLETRPRLTEQELESFRFTPLENKEQSADEKMQRLSIQGLFPTLKDAEYYKGMGITRVIIELNNEPEPGKFNIILEKDNEDR